MTVSGINTAEFSSEIRPQDDLFRYVNGEWIKRTEIPADKARYGSFMVLAENAEAASRDIITGEGENEAELPAEVAADLQKIRTLYSSFMNEERLRELGAAPLEPYFAKIAEVTSVVDLTKLVAELDLAGKASFASMFIDNDPGDPQRYVLFLMQTGLGMPDESYYREAEFAEVREKYQAHIARMFELVGVSAAAERAARVFDLETKIAKHHWNRVDSRDIQKLYNLLPFAELGNQVPGIDWQLYFETLGLGMPAEVVLCQPSAFQGFAELLNSEPLENWLDWLRYRVVGASAGVLSPEISKASFDFHGTVITGAEQQRERWRRGVSMVEGALGEAVGRLYVAKHFDESAKATMDELVAYLIKAYRESITALEWMSTETKERAIQKLEKFVPKIGYPVKWRDYSSLEITEDLFANNIAIAEYVGRREFGKLGKPVDRDEWFMTPQTVNAYYNPGMNEIVFPAAILQPPFFNNEADPAANFGAIGAVIGHEIGHGFDDQGSQYDGDGLLNNWWSDADRKAFEERTRALIDQYNVLSPEGAEGKTVNGELTIGENIGDLGGLSIAWKAYVLFLADQGLTPETAPVIDGLSAAERFLLSWAQCWQLKVRPAEAVRLLTIDPHSPNEFRCNQIVRNLDIFHDTYQTQPGDKLWLDPAERVTIW